jgi:hypothetical protein
MARAMDAVRVAGQSAVLKKALPGGNHHYRGQARRHANRRNLPTSELAEE